MTSDSHAALLAALGAGVHAGGEGVAAGVTESACGSLVVSAEKYVCPDEACTRGTRGANDSKI